MSPFDRFIGIPWLDKGRDHAGCDCWGLVRLVYRECCGCELPCYADSYVTAADRAGLARLIAGELDPWDEIAPGAEEPFDAVLVREGPFPRHIGIVTAPGQMLHVAPGSSSLIERYRTGPLQHRLLGFYRHRAL